jgi:hypothetical protein
LTEIENGIRKVISGALKKLRKLKGITLDEVRVRAAQKAAAVAEQRDWSSLTRVPEDPEFLELLDWTKTSRELWSASELLEYFRSRTEPTFFAAFSDRNSTVDQLNTRWHDAVPRIVEQANGIRQGRFDLLGWHGLKFGQPIDWHLEPTSEKRTPLIHWSKLNYLDAELAGDKKILWELNRHQYFATLGQAYWLTSNEDYAKEFAAHLESWMDANPPKLGINWASSLEVAFRSISWLWGFYFFKDSPALTSRIFIRALKHLYLNARHLETYLSTYFSPNTHLTGEALGLFYLGTLLPEFKEAKRWRETGTRILLEQLPIHVRPDGVYFEQSSYYHRYTADFYTHFLILSEANGVALPASVNDKLQSLLNHLMYITRPDGTTPLFGDDDGGRLVMLDDRPANDFRATLSTGAALFDRSDYKFMARGLAQETLWLLGNQAVEDFDRIVAEEPAQKSVAFEDGGYYVMRDDWTTEANYLLFDCGPHGQANCGHAHADALSFDLAANGRTLLVDPGTYTYTRSSEMRDWFRRSAAHNSLTIGGRSSSVSAGPFSWTSIANCKRLAWHTQDRFDYVSATHDGYSGATPRAEHTRSIFFLKHDYWMIRDYVHAQSETVADLWFHFESAANPLIDIGPEERAFISDAANPKGLDLHAFSENGRWKREDGWVSHCYSQRESARIYVFSMPVSAESNVVSFLLPWEKGKRWQVREIEVVGGRAFEVANDKWLDIVMIRTQEKAETARVSSDFEWSWTRFLRSDETSLVEAVLLGGKTFALDGRLLFSTNNRLDYVLASRAGEEFRIETNEGKLNSSFPIVSSEPFFSDSQSAV